MTEEIIEEPNSYNFEESLNKSTQYYNNMKLAKSYKFENFDPIKDLEKCKNFAGIITSKRRTGKSVFMNDVLSKIHKWYMSGYVFSMTSHLQPDLYNFCPKENIFNSFNEEKLNQIWTAQEQLVTGMRANKTKDEDIPHIMIVFDDVISDPKVRNSEILKRFFVCGRHIKIAFFLITQNFSSIPPLFRNNCDFSVAFYIDSATCRDAYCMQYLSTKNKNVGKLIFENITTQEYQCIVCLNYKTNSDPQETVRTYTASLKVPKFKIGTKMKSHSFVSDRVSPAQEGTGAGGFFIKVKRGGMKI